MRIITATEFKTHFKKYLDLALEEEILITRYGHLLYTFSKAKIDSWHDLAEKWKQVKKYEIDEDDPKILHMLGKL